MSEPREEFRRASLDDFRELVLPDTMAGYLILGPVGTGKTHLAAALYWAAQGERIFATARNWLRAFKAEFDGRSIPELPAEQDEEIERWSPAVYLSPKVIKGRMLSERASAAEFIVIDDYGAQYPTDWAREQLLGILDDRCGVPGKLTVVTSNLDAAALKGTDERFFDRLRYLQVVTLTGKSRRRAT
ncbi:MAG: hypothetical protein JXQ29_16375 [Planctomycetes bacterium]|nr:hypothetical protein [Planctomycetota bacterium]